MYRTIAYVLLIKLHGTRDIVNEYGD